MELKWEEVEQKLDGHMYRVKVPGGYLYRLDVEHPHPNPNDGMSAWGHGIFQSSICFVPDPHEICVWKEIAVEQPKNGN